ncbi:MAG TPA: DUF4375 domain-containing protein [Nitrososphaera sp.]|jgi:hypothetical protein|nr:DUF4375 domain-containing protein [Nitrososphaera sp.]
MSQKEDNLGADYWRVIEPYWEAISIYDGPKVFLKQFHAVEPHVRHLFAAHWLYAEVCNGGFDQFFANSTGVLAPEAAEGFRAIGLDDYAAVIEEAIQLFGSSYPREQDKRNDLLDAMSEDMTEENEPLGTLTDHFIGLIKEGRFLKAADQYARSHAA